MLLNIGTDEKILKSWDYASEKDSKDQSQANLTVTNRRVISIISNAHKYEYSEVPVDSIRRIDAYRDKKPNNGLAVLIFGIILVIVGIVVACTLKITVASMYVLFPAFIGVILCIVGIAMLCNKNKGTFYISFSLSGNEAGKLDIGAQNATLKKKNSQTVSVKIDFNLVDDMLTSLGAIIYNIKNANLIPNNAAAGSAYNGAQYAPKPERDGEAGY